MEKHRKHEYSVVATGAVACVVAVHSLSGCGSGDVAKETRVGTVSAPLVTPAGSVGSPSGAPETQSWEEWHKAMVKTPFPKEGCFQASHPDTTWKEIPCAIAPPVRRSGRPNFHPRTTGNMLESPGPTGGGVDYSPQVSGTISSVTGSFPSVINVNTVTSSNDSGVSVGSYGLQMNTNNFQTPLCNGKAGCYGWQQFVFGNDTTASYGALLWIEYWLFGYGATAPPNPYPNDPNMYWGCDVGGWKKGQPCSGSIVQNDAGGSSCVRPAVKGGQPCVGSWVLNGYGANPKLQPVANLANFTLTGSAVLGGTDPITLTTGSGQPVYAVNKNSDSVLSLGQAGLWNQVEFNVVGVCCGDVATFNDNATITVRTTVTSGTTASPTCTKTGTTAETNNLNLVDGSCCASGGTSPAIQFVQSNVSPLPKAPFCLLNDIAPIGFPLL